MKMTQGMTLRELRTSLQAYRKDGCKALVPYQSNVIQSAKKSNIITHEVVLDAAGCWVIPANLFKTGEAACYDLNYRGQIVGYINHATCRIEIVIKDPAISIKIDKKIKSGYFSITSVGKVTLAKKVTSEYFAIEGEDIVCQETIKSDFLSVKAQNGFTNFKSITAREDLDILASEYMNKAVIKSKNLVMNISGLLTNEGAIMPSKKIIVTGGVFKNQGSLKLKEKLELAVTRFENTITGDVSVDSITSFNTTEFIQHGYFRVQNPGHFNIHDFSNYGHTKLPLGTIVEADSLYLKKSSIFECDKSSGVKGQDFSIAPYPLTQIKLNKQVIVEEGASLHLTQTSISSGERIKIKGEMRSHKTQITTDSFEFLQGFIEIKETSLSASKNIELLGRSELQEAVIEGHEILIGGRMNVKDSALMAKKILSTRNESTVHVDGTLFRSDISLNIAGQIKAKAKSTLRAKYIKQDGDLTVSESAIIAGSSLIESPSASIRVGDGSLVKVSTAKLSGGMQLDKSSLTAEQLEFNKTADVTQSKVEVAKPMTVTPGAAANFTDCEIKAESVLNEGKFTVQGGCIIGDDITNADGMIKLSKATVELKKTLKDSPNAIWKIDDGVAIRANNVSLDGKSLMKKSFIKVAESFWQFGEMQGSGNKIEALEVFTGADSKTSASQSRIIASQIQFKGKTHLTQDTGVFSDSLTFGKGKTYLEGKSFLQSERSIITTSDSSVQLDTQSALGSKVAIFDGSVNVHRNSHVRLVDAAILNGSSNFSDSLLESDLVYFMGDKQHQLDKSQIKSKKINSDAQLKVTGKSLLQADSSWVVGKKGVIVLEDSCSKTDGDLSVLGKASFVRSVLQAREAMIYGDLEAKKAN